MRKPAFILRGLIAASALALTASPAWAGDEERALAAIAQAQGKIDAANRVKGGEVSPEAIARAQASLRLAQEELKSGHEQKAIQAAIESQQFADTAIGRAQQQTEAAVQAEAATAASAQQEAAAANARAEAAEQAAARAQADAQAARTPIVAVPATTTVTTETVKTVPAPAKTTAVRKPVRKVVRKTSRSAPRATVSEKTTTTVTTQ